MIRSMFFSLASGSLALSGLPGESATRIARPVGFDTERAPPQVLDLRLVGTVEAAVDGTVEGRTDSKAPILVAVPIMVFIILLLTMMQVQGFPTMFVVMAARPLGNTDVLALTAIRFRNAIILAQATDALIAVGKTGGTRSFSPPVSGSGRACPDGRTRWRWPSFRGRSSGVRWPLR